MTTKEDNPMNGELATMEHATLAVPREPELVLEEAQRAAAALKRVIDGKPNKVMFGTEQYIEHEDWQTVGRFYGLAEQIIWTRPVTVGDASGWEARAEAVHVGSGRVVASAEAMCLNDEEKWRARPKYAWVYHKRSGGTSVDDPGKDELIWEKSGDGKNRPKKSKELIGEETVPQFQLRSMAQTRAGAKALRNALGWVVVLAGYKPTPAEEMDVRHEPTAPVAAPIPTAEIIEAEAQRIFDTPPAPDATDPGGVSIETERSLYLGKINDWRTKRGVTEARFADLCKAEGLTVPTLGQAEPAALSNLMNRVIREPKK